MNKDIILVCTFSRADYGKLKSTLYLLREKRIPFKIFCAGLHLVYDLGLTWKEVEKDFPDELVKIDTYLQTSSYIESSILILKELTKALEAHRPALALIHGDRYESLCAAYTFTLNNIPIAHIEGGEITGTTDEHFRHAISKLSHFHFVTNAVSTDVLIKLGEKKENIHKVGNPSLDILAEIKHKDLDTSEVSSRYNLDIKKNKFVIFLFHPVATVDSNSPELKIGIDCLDYILEKGANVIAIKPNLDRNYEKIHSALEERENKLTALIPSMRFELFLQLLYNSEYIIGNSSLLFHEAPFIGLKAFNIGSRQEGRRAPESTVHIQSLDQFIEILNSDFLETSFDNDDFYGSGEANQKIVNEIEQILADNKKQVFQKKLSWTDE